MTTLDVGIDLGTANTVVHVRGKGIVIRQPSVVARHKKTGEILAIGEEARKMLGKNPASIEVIRPLRDGVIADFDATEAMLKHYIVQVHETYKGLGFKMPRPRVVVGIPSGVTEVERRAVYEAAITAGASFCATSITTVAHCSSGRCSLRDDDKTGSGSRSRNNPAGT